MPDTPPPLPKSTRLGLITLLAAAVSVTSATQDIVVDAVAVRLLTADERGFGNGIQVAGSYVGFTVGGGGSLLVYGFLGWPAAAIALAALTLVPWFAVLRLPGLTGAAPAARIGLADWISFFRRPTTARWTLTGIPPLLIGMGIVNSLMSPMLIDKGWPAARVGVYSVLIGGAVSTAAALVCGALFDRIGRTRAILLFGALQLGTVAAMLPVALGEAPGTAMVLLAVTGAGAGTVGVVTFAYTVAMNLSRPDRAGSDFTVQACLMLLCSQGFGSTALGLTGTVGYPGVLALAAVITLLGVPAALGALRSLTPATTAEVPA